MLLNMGLKTSSVWYVALTVVFNICLAQQSVASDNIEYYYKKLLKSLGKLPLPDECRSRDGNVAGLLQAFCRLLKSDDQQSRELLKQWDDYVNSVSLYPGSLFFKSIEKQQRAYLSAIATIEKSLLEEKSFKNAYASSWVEDLISHFGKGFIKNNRDAIVQNFRSIASGAYRRYEEALKELIFIEAMLYGSYKNYIRMFQDFYNRELDIEGRSKLESLKNAADSFLMLINHFSITLMYNNSVLIQELSDSSARQINEELFLFMKNHPITRTFDDLQAYRDLENAITADSL